MFGVVVSSMTAGPAEALRPACFVSPGIQMVSPGLAANQRLESRKPVASREPQAWASWTPAEIPTARKGHDRDCVERYRWTCGGSYRRGGQAGDAASYHGIEDSVIAEYERGWPSLREFSCPADQRLYELGGG